jgi:hypothetical protein
VSYNLVSCTMFAVVVCDVGESDMRLPSVGDYNRAREPSRLPRETVSPSQPSDEGEGEGEVRRGFSNECDATRLCSD